MAQKHNLTIQVVSIIGGILTAIFFLGFLALARILRSDISCLIAGSILILTTLTISRMVVRSFLDAMNITLYIAGCVLIGFGINASINLLFITLMGISILTFLLCIWIGILIMVQRIMQVMKVDHPVNQVGIYILCIVICLPTVFAPYLSGSLLLILICFHYGYKAECAASLLLFIYAVSKYYYDLNLSLLTKSITLFFIGIACITAWYFFTQKRTRHEKV